MGPTRQEQDYQDFSKINKYDRFRIARILHKRRNDTCIPKGDYFVRFREKPLLSAQIQVLTAVASTAASYLLRKFLEAKKESSWVFAEVSYKLRLEVMFVVLNSRDGTRNFEPER